MLDFLAEVRQSMARRKLTYFLAVLSLAVGVAAYLCVVGLWDALYRDQMARARNHPESRRPSFRMELARRQQEGAPRRELEVAPVASLAKQISSGQTAFLEGYQADVKLRRWALLASVSAVSEEWLSPEFHSSPVVLKGRTFSPADYREGHAVCLVTDKVADVLGRFGEPIGQTIRLAGSRFTVVGVEAVRNGSQFMAVTIPFPAARAHLAGQKAERATVISFTEADRLTADMDRVEAAVNALTGGSYRWREESAGAEGDGAGPPPPFTLSSNWLMARDYLRSMQRARLRLGLLASVSLVAGLLGLVSMLLANLGNRTYEIGLYRALGASRWRQAAAVLCEATTTGLLGGLVGIGLGYGLLRVLARGFGSEIVPPAPWLFAAIGSSVVSAFLAGLIPARAAMRISPAQSLRAL